MSKHRPCKVLRLEARPRQPAELGRRRYAHDAPVLLAPPGDGRHILCLWLRHSSAGRVEVVPTDCCPKATKAAGTAIFGSMCDLRRIEWALAAARGQQSERSAGALRILHLQNAPGAVVSETGLVPVAHSFCAWSYFACPLVRF